MLSKFFIVFIAYLAVATIAYGQQNYKFENFGDRSMLLNGNVTGSVNDLGATYYNPSRLTTIEEPLFSINGKVYQLNTIKLDNLTASGHTISDSDFAGLPRMVAGTFRLKWLPNSYLAYSFLTRQRTDLNVAYATGLQTSDIIAGQEGDETYQGQVAINNKVNEEWYGASWATKINEKLSFGQIHTTFHATLHM